MASVTDIARRLYVQPGRREQFKRSMEKHATITDFESEIFRKDGSTIWISENCRAIRDASGRLLYYEGTVEDITQRRAAEENVRHSEALYHSLVETIPQNIFRKDTEGRFIFANQRFCSLLGTTLAEITGKTDFDFFPKALAEKYRTDDRRVMETGQAIETIEEHQEPGREKMYVQVIKSPLHDAFGRVIGVQGMFWDITKERQMEDSLRNSEALYHSLVETMPQAVFRRDRQGRFTFVNQPYCKYHKLKPEDLIGKTDFDRFPKEAAQKYWADDLRVMETGETMEIIEESQPVGATEKEHHHVIKTPLREATGQILGLQGMFWDITKERKMEENLRNSEALYHSLVETMPQCIFRKDLRGRYTFVNPQFCTMLGKTPEELLGRTIYDFLPRDLAEMREQDDLRVIESGKPIEHIEESKFRDTERQFIHVLKLPIFDAHGKVVGLQGMFWDITKQKTAEEELARSREELRVKNLLMEDDLKMAREIQLTMLPQQYPILPRGAAAAESAFQFTHRYLPTGAVGGDFFAVSALSDTEVAVFICDVAGHGVRSALVTAMVRALIEELRPLAHDPGQFMTKLNSDLFAMLKHSDSPVLTTAFYLVADAATGAMRYANAGHPRPLHITRDAGKVEVLKTSARKSQPALGLFEKAPYQTSVITLAPRDLVMMFTDGLYEVHAPTQELYTQDMLLAAANARLQSPAPVLFDELLHEIRAFCATGEFDDDVCLVGMEFTRLVPVKPA